MNLYDERVEKSETMSSKSKSTFDKFMENDKQKELFDKEYAQFLFSEFLFEAMEPETVTLKTISSLMHSLGYELTAQMKSKQFSSSQQALNVDVCSDI